MKVKKIKQLKKEFSELFIEKRIDIIKEIGVFEQLEFYSNDEWFFDNMRGYQVAKLIANSPSYNIAHSFVYYEDGETLVSCSAIEVKELINLEADSICRYIHKNALEEKYIFNEYDFDIYEYDMNSKVRDLFKFMYPYDNDYELIYKNVTFGDVYKALEDAKDIYMVIGVDITSYMREFIFEKLGEILGVEYEIIYYMWLNKDLE